MCGPFQGFQGTLRLLEIILSAAFVIIPIFKGRMLSPWGVWCEFVWVFCVIVPVVVVVVESKNWHGLLAACLPNWADLTCGLTVLCAVMIVSATVIFTAVFVCLTCVTDYLCAILSLAATVVFLIDAVKQKMALPCGYLSSTRGILRTMEAFVACVVLTAAADHFTDGEWSSKPFGMICSCIVFGVCLLITVTIIVLNLLAFGPNVMECVFNSVAVALYLLAVILYAAFGYKRLKYNPYTCGKCSYANMNTVTAGGIFNLVVYIVDLVLSIKSS